MAFLKLMSPIAPFARLIVKLDGQHTVMYLPPPGGESLPHGVSVAYREPAHQGFIAAHQGVAAHQAAPLSTKG